LGTSYCRGCYVFEAAFLVFASPDAMLGTALLATFFTFLF
jgi:hypothetical protein